MPTQPQKLTRREREIMDILFGLGQAAAEEIRERLTDPPSYSAVRTMLARLEAKGTIRHHEEGLRYVYTPTTSPAAARRSALKQHARTFFGGSFGELVTSLLRQETWTDDELNSLRDEIERARARKEEEVMTPELDILMKVTMVLLLGLIATRLAARARASVRHLLLASTLGALIALPLAAALAPDLVVAIQLPQATDPGAAPTDAAAFARAQAPARPEGLVSSAATSLDGARAAWQASTGMSIPAALRLLWAAGAVLLLAFLANALRQVRAVRRSGIPWLAGQTAARGAGPRFRHQPAADRHPARGCAGSGHLRVEPSDHRASDGRPRLERIRSAARLRPRARTRPPGRLADAAGGTRDLRRLLVSSARLGRLAPALSRERARLRRCRGQPGGAGRLRGTAGDPGGAAGAQPGAAGAVDGQSQRPLGARQGRARSHAAPRPRWRVAGGGNGGRGERVRPGPGTRARGGRSGSARQDGRRPEGSAVGNDRVRASTQSAQRRASSRPHRRATSTR